MFVSFLTMKLLLLLAVATIGHCSLLGSKKCTYGPSYWCSHIHNAKECSAVQHCLTTVWKNQKPGMTGSTETCFDVIQILDVVRKGSESKLLERLATGCTAMPEDKRSKCKELMTHDQEEVFLMLQSDLPSMQIASALGLCGGFPDSVPHAKVAGDYCTDCVNFFTDIREIFNNSQGQVEDVLKDLVCSKLGPLKNLCDMLVDQYANMVYSIIYQQLNPEDICILFQLCTNQTHAELMKSIQYIMAQRVRSNMTCDLCLSIAKDVQDALRDPSLQNDIVSALENDVCTLLPGDLAIQCKSYVQGYAPFVFQILVSELDPTTICQTLGFCSATVSASTLVAVPLSSSAGSVHIIAPQLPGPQCALCEFVLNKLMEMITSNSTEQEIIDALDKVCSLLPDSLSAECDAFVQEYSNLIIQLLLKQITPQEICTILTLCTASQKKEQVKPVLLKPEGLKNGSQCIICEQVVSFVKAELDKSGSEQSIEQILDRVCSIFPSSYKASCDEFVQTYTPTIIMLIEQFADPKQICTAIGLCTSEKDESLKFQPMMELSPSKPHLLGSIKCTWGPSYWCKNENTAKECNAVEHCVKYRNLKIGA